MNPTRVLVVVALVLAILGAAFSNIIAVAVAVVLLAVRELQ